MNPFEPGLGADDPAASGRAALYALGGVFVGVLAGWFIGRMGSLGGLGRLEGRRLRVDDEATVRERVGRFAAGERVVIVSSHASKSEGLKYKVVSDAGAEGWVPDWVLGGGGGLVGLAGKPAGGYTKERTETKVVKKYTVANGVKINLVRESRDYGEQVVWLTVQYEDGDDGVDRGFEWETRREAVAYIERMKG